jgi:very-short-patch-repair endonuclease
MFHFSSPKPKKRTKRISPRGRFKAFGANPLKTYRRKRTDAEVMSHALQRRHERLMNRTKAEVAFAELLDSHRILYEVEKIFLNGDRHILVDFYFQTQMLAVEIDGSAHDTQKKYDAGRDRGCSKRMECKQSALLTPNFFAEDWICSDALAFQFRLDVFRCVVMARILVISVDTFLVSARILAGSSCVSSEVVSIAIMASSVSRTSASNWSARCAEASAFADGLKR